MLHLHINPGSGLPIYLQIIEELKLLLAAGVLKGGDQLPSVRSLSVALRINPNTVAKAYTELEREGVTQTRRGEGTFVSGTQSDLGKKSQMEIITKKTDEFVRTAIRFNIAREALLKLVREQYDDIRREKEVK